MALVDVVRKYRSQGQRLFKWGIVTPYGEIYGRDDTPTGLHSEDSVFGGAYAMTLLQQLNGDAAAGRITVHQAGADFLREVFGGGAPGGGGASPGGSGAGAGAAPALKLGSLSSLLANRPVLIGLGAAVGYLLGGRKPMVPVAIGAGAGWFLGGKAADGQTQAQKLIGGGT